MQPEPEEFLDQVLLEVGEVRDASFASRRAAAAAAAAASAAGGGDADEAWGTDGGEGAGGGGGATKYSLAASAACEYDPTFLRLNRTEHQVSERGGVRERGAERERDRGRGSRGGIQSGRDEKGSIHFRGRCNSSGL